MSSTRPSADCDTLASPLLFTKPAGTAGQVQPAFGQPPLLAAASATRAASDQPSRCSCGELVGAGWFLCCCTPAAAVPHHPRQAENLEHAFIDYLFQSNDAARHCSLRPMEVGRNTHTGHSHLG